MYMEVQTCPLILVCVARAVFVRLDVVVAYIVSWCSSTLPLILMAGIVNHAPLISLVRHKYNPIIGH